MTRLFIQDRQTYKTTHREYTDEGFLRVPGRVAKTGTQQYLRRELGLDGDQNAVVTVYRAPEEVFSADSLATYNATDITIHHPKKLVDSTTFKDVAAGVVSSQGRKDGDFVVCDLIVKDAQAIKQIESGLVELSAGYTAEYVHAPGVTADGVPYEYMQRDIKINHVALVPTARAGRQARIFDTNPEGKTMSKVTLDSGREVEVQDNAAALLISDYIDRLKATADAAKESENKSFEKAAKAESKADMAEAKADALEAEAEKKKSETTDSIVSARVAQLLAVKDQARVIGVDYTIDCADPVALMRGVMKGIRSTVDWDSKSADYVQASFDMAHEQAKSGGSVKNADQLARMTSDAASGPIQVKPSAYEAHKATMAGAWKKSVQ